MTPPCQDERDSRRPMIISSIARIGFPRFIFELVQRQHMCPILQFAIFCFNRISSANTFAHLGIRIDLQPHFLTVNPLDEIAIAFYAQHLALEGLDTLLCFFSALHEIRFSGFPSSTGDRGQFSLLTED